MTEPAATDVTAGPSGPVEMVLPLVIRAERAAPPQRTEALEAAARAVLMMVTTDDPAWRAAVAAWDAHRIRKVVRRARGTDWQRAAAIDGLTITQGTAQVRVFPPIPLDGWPRELARLQVGGTDFTDDQPAGPATSGVPLVLLSPAVEMTAGKAMAQAGHAAQLGWRAASAGQRSAWRESGFAVSVRVATPAQWTSARATDAPVVRDAGFTEVEPNSETATVLLPTSYG